MFEFLKSGGFMMWILLAWSILGLGFILDRVVVLWFRYRINQKEFAKRIWSFVSSNNYSRAIELCNGIPNHPLSKVLKAGLLKANI